MPKASQSLPVAILLAAGESSRMGTLKALLEWDGQPLIAYQIGELQAAGIDLVIAVLGHRANELQPVVEGSGGVPVINTDYLAGRAGSIRAGALAVPDGATAIVVVSVDQPRERGITQRLLALQKDRDALIAVPSFRGQRGHPAILDGSLLDELRNVNEAGEGLRTLMRRHAAERVEVAFDTATVVLDLNRPDEYEAARSKYLGR